MARAEKRAIRSQLIRLMIHIMKWNLQPERRSSSWVATILNARDEIEDEQEFSPSLNRTHIEEVWNHCFQKAKKQAEAETRLSTKHIENLTWKEVFEDEYMFEIE